MVKRELFLNALASIGIELSIIDKMHIKNLFTPAIFDMLNVTSIIEAFEKLEIYEDVPKDTAFLKFSILSTPAVRLFNRINKYLSKKDISNFEDILPKDIINPIEVVSKSKTHNVDAVKISDLRSFFTQQKILSYGEEICEKFIEFLQISPEYDDVIMLKKLNKGLEKVQ